MYAVKNIQRHAAMNGAISPSSFRAGRGIPQGDPLSMLVAAAALGQWARGIPASLRVNHVFVDDRLLLHDEPAHLQAVFNFTQNWDSEHSFSTKPKTLAFGTNPPNQNLVWLDGEPVTRAQGNVIYLGVPLPFLDVKREEFFAPIISKLCTALHKTAKARIPFHQASIIVALKAAPSLAYAAMVARPTQKQLSRLRDAIYKACADRHFATHDAQAIFLHRTHLHDPEAAMVYASLCGWHRALQFPVLLHWLQQNWNTPSRRKAKGKGPLNLLSYDIEWLNCDFNLEDLTILSKKDGTCISLREHNKSKFQHFLREQIRGVFLAKLQQKHERWEGVLEADIPATTALFRKMHPQTYGRTALMRLLSNAHATPHRLHKQNIVATPACSFCGCTDADVLHIAFHCPRFQFIRDDWADITHTWQGWPSCAKICLVATTSMPVHLRKNWWVVQQDIARLFEAWMAFRRNGSLVQAVTPQSHAIEIARDKNAVSHNPDLSHNAIQRIAPLVQPAANFPQRSGWINLQWQPPTSTWAYHKWGANAKDYATLFSFWSRWTLEAFEGAVPCHNWTVAFMLFMQRGGQMASFVHRCPNLGTIIWKFRNLSLTLLENAWPNEPDFQSLQFDKNDDVHWCLRMPPAKPFPPLFFHSAPWDLRDKCVSVVELQTQTAIRKNMQYKHHLLEIPQFLDLFPVPDNTFLRTDTLSPIWVGRRPRKTRLLNWELEALNLTGCQTVRSVAAKPLQFWLPLGVEEIKAHISPPSRLGASSCANTNFSPHSKWSSPSISPPAQLKAYRICPKLSGRKIFRFVAFVPINLTSSKSPKKSTGSAPVRSFCPETHCNIGSNPVS